MKSPGAISLSAPSAAQPAAPRAANLLRSPDLFDFLARLGESCDRIAREGPSTEDVLAAAGLAPLLPGVAAACHDRAGRYLWVSPHFEVVSGLRAADVLGKLLAEVFDPAWAEERLRVIHNAVQSGRPLSTVEIFRGKRLEGLTIPVLPRSESAMVVFIGRFGLAISRCESGSVPAAPEVNGRASPLLKVPGQAEAPLNEAYAPVFLRRAEWGPLSALSRRELEVLRLIAMGHENDEIARLIHRTKRAVEWHISHLYRFLNCARRTDLFRIGLTAGLADIDDAHWEAMVAHVHAHRPEESPGDD